MLIGIDHFIVATTDPDRAAEKLERTVGVHAGAGGRHEAHGTFNRLAWLGDSYIELMGVFDAALAARSWFGSHALSVTRRAESGALGVVLASDDLRSDMALLRGVGSILGEPEEGQRVRPDGRVVRWRLAHAPAPDPELGLTFLIEHDLRSAEWTEADRRERAAEPHPLGGPARLARVELAVADMRTSTMRLHRDLGVPFRPSLEGGGARDATIGVQTLRLVRSGPAAAPPTVVIRGGSQRREAVALGCRWLVEPAAGQPASAAGERT